MYCALKILLKLLLPYKVRKGEDKYSHVALLSEIAENDYNLNIPRYVDTFEEEEAVVNLKTVSAFCKELGRTPF
jgi:type I restriction enzyme M protein